MLVVGRAATRSRRLAGIPTVVAGRPPRGGRRYVDADNVGGAPAVRLWSSGVGVTAPSPGRWTWCPARPATGWEKALAAAGRTPEPDLVAAADFTRSGGEAATRRLLERHPDLDGLFVASDLMALGALDALRAAGRRVPDDVAVVGRRHRAGPLRRLTTVRQPLEQLGAVMARLLLDQLDRDRPPTGVVLDTDLVVRASA